MVKCAVIEMITISTSQPIVLYSLISTEKDLNIALSKWINKKEVISHWKPHSIKKMHNRTYPTPLVAYNILILCTLTGISHLLYLSIFGDVGSFANTPQNLLEHDK